MSRVSFIIASPRSGTTWLKEALNAHPDVLCVEKRLFGMYCDLVRDSGAARPRVRITLDRYVDAMAATLGVDQRQLPGLDLRAVLLSGLAHAEDALLLKQSARQHLVDKVTPYADTAEIVAAGITRAYPEAKIVQLVRDGRDVATSGVFHWLNKQVEGGSLNDQQKGRRARFVDGQCVSLPRFFCDQDLDEWASLWLTGLRTAELLARGHSVHTVRYESLLSDFESSFEQILSFLGQRVTREILKDCMEAASFIRMTGGRERGVAEPAAHIRKGVTGDWRNYFTRCDGSRFQQLAGQKLAEFGYANGDDWLEDLPSRLPD